MAGLMKFACLVLACMIVAGPITTNAQSCWAINNIVTSCSGYLTQSGTVLLPCCGSLRNLSNIARTTHDRQQACRCLKNAAKFIGFGLNASRAAELPRACRVILPFPLSISTNCNNVK